MNDTALLLERSRCSVAEMELLKPLMETLFEQAFLVHQDGPLSLEDTLDEVEPLFLKASLEMVMNGVPEEAVTSIVTNQLFLSGKVGRELLEMCLIREAIFSMFRRESFKTLGMRLQSWLGPEGAGLVPKYFEVPEPRDWTHEVRVSPSEAGYPEQVTVETARSLIAPTSGKVLAGFLRLCSPPAALNLFELLEPERKAAVLAGFASGGHLTPAESGEVLALVQAFRAAERPEPVSAFSTAAMLVGCDRSPNLHQAMAILRNSSPALARRLDEKHFAFEDVVMLGDADLVTILRSVPHRTLCLALKGSDSEVLGKFTRNLGLADVNALLEDLAYMGPVRRSDIQRARDQVVVAVRRLEQAGEITIRNSYAEDEEVTV